VFIHIHWIEVDPHRYNLYSFKEQNNPLITEPIPALNHYASLINVQEPLVNTNAVVVFEELGLPYDIQREEL
jgi:hypothetical protein